MATVEMRLEDFHKPPEARFVKDENGNLVMKIFEEGDEDGLTVEDFERKKKTRTIRGVARVTPDDDEIHPERSL